MRTRNVGLVKEGVVAMNVPFASIAAQEDKALAGALPSGRVRSGPPDSGRLPTATAALARRVAGKGLVRSAATRCVDRVVTPRLFQ